MLALSRVLLVVVCLALFLAAAPAGARADSLDSFPDVIPLPNGFAPEGIVIGRGTAFYVGSLVTGAIYQGDLSTGAGQILVPPQDGRIAVGLAYDERTNWIYVAGGPAGAGYIYNAKTGAGVAAFQFTSGPSFVNDVVVTPRGAYFTDSFRPVLYQVLLRSDGTLVAGGSFREIPLGGDFNFIPDAFNTNGIEATPDGRHLIIVNSSAAALYVVNPKTGLANQIDLGGAAVPNGDGLLLDGNTLYVVQNMLNQIAVIRLSSNLLSGRVVDVITDPNFDVPTTLDDFEDFLYVVNARFGVPPTPETEYQVVRVPKN
jgi:hypothetical protein